MLVGQLKLEDEQALTAKTKAWLEELPAGSAPTPCTWNTGATGRTRSDVPGTIGAGLRTDEETPVAFRSAKAAYFWQSEKATVMDLPILRVLTLHGCRLD